MGFFSKVKTAWRTFNSLEDPAMSLNDPKTWDALFSRQDSVAGEQVTAMKALTLASVWQAVSTISGDVASLPLNFMETQEPGTRAGDKKVAMGPINFMVSEEPNSETSAYDFWRTMLTHALLWGNGYALIERASFGQPTRMVNLLPDKVEVFRDEEGSLFYEAEINKVKRLYMPNEIFHLKGLIIEPGIGTDFIQSAKDVFGILLAAQNFTGKFFENGAQQGGVLTVPNTMSQPARDNLAAGFNEKVGKENWFKFLILRDGATFMPTTVNAEQSQLNEMMERMVREVGRYFNLPAFKLGLTDSQSYNSIEQAQLIYLQSTLRHWIKCITGEADLKLRTMPEKRRLTRFFEVDVSKIIETDSKTFNEVLELQRRNLIITTNQWLSKINENKSDDPIADKLLNPNTYVDPDTQAARKSSEPPPSSSPEDPEEEEVEENKIRMILEDSIYRCVKRVTSQMRKVSKKPQKFLDFVDGQNDIEDILDSTIGITLEALGLGSLKIDIHQAIQSSIIDMCNEFTQPPHQQSDLVKNVEDFCVGVEDTFHIALTNKIIKGKE